MLSHTRRARVGVGQQHQEPTKALHQRRHVGIAGKPGGRKQIALQMAKAVPGGHVCRTARNPALQRYAMLGGPAAMSCSAAPTRTGQAQVELLRRTLGATHVAINRFVAEPFAFFPVSLCFLPEPPCDLLRRPTTAQPVHHVGE